MRYMVLAVDYDGTIARDGAVAPATVAALERLAATGRKLVLVTGRELDELLAIFPAIGVCDRVVAENGALLYCPATGKRKSLGDPPPAAFVLELRRRGVAPLSVGESIVATVHPHETIVIETIRDLGLELQVIFNKGAVMVLPASVNKATGLTAALADLGLSPRNAVAIGDAENDHALLRLAEFGVAVANAVPMLKREADFTSDHEAGDAVIGLVEALIADDLAAASERAVRRRLAIGTRRDGSPVRVPAAGAGLAIAGPSGSGKSEVAAALAERLGAEGYQYCVIDAGGRFGRMPGAILLGTGGGVPTGEEVAAALARPDANVVVDLGGMAREDRPRFLLDFAPRLADLRARTGRPHWLVVDDAHRLLPREWQLPDGARDLGGLLCVTVHPEAVSPAVLAGLHAAIALGEAPEDTLRRLGTAAGATPPAGDPVRLAAGEALVWRLRREAPFVVRVPRSEAERRRRAQRELPEDRSFYFRGADRKLNLRAQTLPLFLQIADGVDDDTWLHHLRQGDYSRWLRAALQDDALADRVAEVERQPAPDPRASRAQVRAALRAGLQ